MSTRFGHVMPKRTLKNNYGNKCVKNITPSVDPKLNMGSPLSYHTLIFDLMSSRNMYLYNAYIYTHILFKVCIGDLPNSNVLISKVSRLSQNN